MTLLQAHKDLIKYADLIASAVVEQIDPRRNFISQRRAYADYGADLIKRGEESGMLKPIRNGKAKNSPILYSRKQILAQIEAEGIMRNEAVAIIKNLK
jgi:hypothetical protein